MTVKTLVATIALFTTACAVQPVEKPMTQLECGYMVSLLNYDLKQQKRLDINAAVNADSGFFLRSIDLYKENRVHYKDLYERADALLQIPACQQVSVLEVDGSRSILDLREESFMGWFASSRLIGVVERLNQLSLFLNRYDSQ